MTKKNRGAPCMCGKGRGFRNERIARAVHDHNTTEPADYDQCYYGKWHWTTKETP